MGRQGLRSRRHLHWRLLFGFWIKHGVFRCALKRILKRSSAKDQICLECVKAVRDLLLAAQTASAACLGLLGVSLGGLVVKWRHKVVAFLQRMSETATHMSNEKRFHQYNGVM